MKGKYIIVKFEYGEQPILFPNAIKHNSFKKMGEIIAAGFWSKNNNKFKCCGYSESLQINSRDQIDADLMEVFFSLDI